MKSIQIILSALLLFGSAFATAAQTPQEKIQAIYDQIVSQSPNTLQSLNSAQRAQLLETVSQHPVAGNASGRKYDRQPTGIGDGEIGFCYGRAMAVHLVARKMGLNPSAIQKIFVAGDLLSDTGIRWRFHMATMVLGDDQKWYVIDPIMPALGRPGVIQPNEWMRVVRAEFDPQNKGQFFVTDTQSILVDMRVVPAEVRFEIADRLIDTTFVPEDHEGFQRVELEPARPSPFPVYQVTGAAQTKYFTLRDEPPLNGKKIDDFDFFSLGIVILFQFPGDPSVHYIPRVYNYNGYFVDLVNSLAP